MNLVGEVLRFGDREFYGDWWSVTFALCVSSISLPVFGLYYTFHCRPTYTHVHVHELACSHTCIFMIVHCVCVCVCVGTLCLFSNSGKCGIFPSIAGPLGKHTHTHTHTHNEVILQARYTCRVRRVYYELYCVCVYTIRHVYQPLRARGCHKGLATFVVFGLSAFFHEVS